MICSVSKIVIRLQGQLSIDAGLVNQNDDPSLRQQLMSSALSIFASTISVLACYHQCQANNRDLRAICIQIFNKNILTQLL